MKKFFLAMLLAMPLGMWAQGGQLNGSGYYRVQNRDTERYFSLVDNKNVTITATNADLEAFVMLRGFEENVAFNAATICYMEQVGNEYNLKGQNLNLHDIAGQYLRIDPRADGSYRIYGYSSGVSIFLVDLTAGGSIHPYTNGSKAFWYFLPVDQSDTQYFGVKPDVQGSDGSYWSTLYAGFAYKPSQSNTKLYRVNRVEGNYAIISEITTDVPTDCPVLVRCGGAEPKSNKLTLVSPFTSNIGANSLVGNYYCNDEEGSPQHRNLTAYKPGTMRMLGTTADGRPAFVKSSISYLPANKCYLSVSTAAPDQLLIVTEEEYASLGIADVKMDDSAADAQWYDMQGRRVSQPGHGIFIVNGKKVVR